MIFAAGLGTRLKPFTNTTPKALVEVAGKPMLYWLIQKMIRYGINEVIINVHHFSSQIQDYLKANNNFGIDITVSDESDALLDTGGGLKKASWFFADGGDFLLHNVDVISDISFGEMLYHHQKSGNAVTLAVSKRSTMRYFLFDDKLKLIGWENKANGERILIQSTKHYNALAFSGLQIINPLVFRYMNRTGRFSLTDEYLNLASQCKIGVFFHHAEDWLDLGRPSELVRAEIMLQNNFPDI